MNDADIGFFTLRRRMNNPYADSADKECLSCVCLKIRNVEYDIPNLKYDRKKDEDVLPEIAEKTTTIPRQCADRRTLLPHK